MSSRGMAWLGGRLYLAYEPGALCQFDPETKQFRVLASSRSLDPQNEFDGGSGYIVESLLADPRQGCLWLSIGSGSSRRGVLRAAESLARQGAGPLETPRQAPATPETAKVLPPLGRDSPGKHPGGAKSSGTGRRGIWRLTPDKMTFTKIYDEPGPLTWTDDARLLFPQPPLGWFTLDTGTRQVRRLEQYGAADPLSLSAAWGRSCIMVNRQIITGDGRLFTADGAVPVPREMARPNARALGPRIRRLRCHYGVQRFVVFRTAGRISIGWGALIDENGRRILLERERPRAGRVRRRRAVCGKGLASAAGSLAAGGLATGGQGLQRSGRNPSIQDRQLLQRGGHLQRLDGLVGESGAVESQLAELRQSRQVCQSVVGKLVASGSFQTQVDEFLQGGQRFEPRIGDRRLDQIQRLQGSDASQGPHASVGNRARTR